MSVCAHACACECVRARVCVCVCVCVLYIYSPLLDYSIPRPKGHRYIRRQFFVTVNRRPSVLFSYSPCAIEFNGTGDRPFLGAFAKLREATVSFLMSDSQSVCPHGATRLHTGQIFIKFNI